MQNKEKLTIISIVNITLLVVGMVCLVVGSLKLILGDVGLATTGLGAGLLLLFSATIERFESLKGMSLEVTTRKLNDKIFEADKAVQELKQLAEISGHTLSLLAAKVGRWGGSLTFEENYSLAQKIRHNLTNLQCDPNSIAHALQPWINITISDLARSLLEPIEAELRIIETQIQDTLNKMQSPINPTDCTYLETLGRLQRLSEHLNPKNAPTLQSNEKILESINIYISTAPELNENTKEKHFSNVLTWTPEVEYLLKNNDIKTPSKWATFLNNDS